MLDQLSPSPENYERLQTFVSDEDYPKGLNDCLGGPGSLTWDLEYGLPRSDQMALGKRYAVTDTVTRWASSHFAGLASQLPPRLTNVGIGRIGTFGCRRLK